MTPLAAYARAVAAVQDGGEFEGFTARADDFDVQASGALSWCFAPQHGGPGCFFVHVHRDRSVTFTTLPHEEEVMSGKFTAEECDVWDVNGNVRVRPDERLRSCPDSAS